MKKIREVCITRLLNIFFSLHGSRGPQAPCRWHPSPAGQAHIWPTYHTKLTPQMWHVTVWPDLLTIRMPIHGNWPLEWGLLWVIYCLLTFWFHYQSLAMARTNWKIFYKSPIPDFTDEFQMVLWSHVKIAENHCTFFCPFPKTILKPRGSKWVLRAFSAEAVTGGIEEALNQLFHLTDHITWMIPFFPSCFLNNTWVEKG